MIDCGNFSHKLISNISKDTIGSVVVVKATIDSIDDGANTADITLVTTCTDVTIPTEDVDFFYHCENSNGSEEDLANGYKAFLVDDEVFVVHIPVDIAETYIVGHADIANIKTCGSLEYIQIELGEENEDGDIEGAVIIYDTVNKEIITPADATFTFPVLNDDVDYLAWRDGTGDYVSEHIHNTLLWDMEDITRTSSTQTGASLSYRSRATTSNTWPLICNRPSPPYSTGSWASAHSYIRASDVAYQMMGRLDLTRLDLADLEDYIAYPAGNGENCFLGFTSTEEYNIVYLDNLTHVDDPLLVITIITDEPYGRSSNFSIGSQMTWTELNIVSRQRTLAYGTGSKIYYVLDATYDHDMIYRSTIEEDSFTGIVDDTYEWEHEYERDDTRPYGCAMWTKERFEGDDDQGRYRFYIQTSWNTEEYADISVIWKERDWKQTSTASDWSSTATWHYDLASDFNKKLICNNESLVNGLNWIYGVACAIHFKDTQTLIEDYTSDPGTLPQGSIVFDYTDYDIYTDNTIILKSSLLNIDDSVMTDEEIAGSMDVITSEPQSELNDAIEALADFFIVEIIQELPDAAAETYVGEVRALAVSLAAGSI